MNRPNVLTIYFLFLTNCVNCEIFSSVAQLETLFNAGKDIIEVLTDYVKELQEKIGVVGKFIYQFHHLQLPPEAEKLVSNPLSSFKLIKQLTQDWKPIEKIMDAISQKNLIQQIKNRHPKFEMPQLKDFQGAMIAVLRLQQTYLLNASDLASGNILSLQTSARLTAEDCLQLGKLSFDNEFFDLASQWYNVTLSINKRELKLNPLLIEKAIKELDSTKQKIGDEQHKIKHQKRTFSKAVIIEKNNLEDETMIEDAVLNYQALCRGEKIMSAAEEANLNCYLSTRGHPSFFINPIKVEVLSHELPLLIFHDVIYESEINFIKASAIPSLQRTPIGNMGEIKDVHISQYAGLLDNLKDNHNQFRLKTLIDRLSRITGLNVYGKENSEPLQVSNYGIGGHFEPHHDYYPKDLFPYERLATIILYLSDVPLGGATVFPVIGAAVVPRKGAVAIWYNIYRNSSINFLSMHAGCPVLYGSKWVGVKWIFEKNQVFKRPCGLNPTD